MQFLNNLVEDNNYTIPLIQDIVDATQGTPHCTVIDLTDAYYQEHLKPEDKLWYYFTTSYWSTLCFIRTVDQLS